MISKVIENISWNKYFNSAYSGVVLDRKQDSLRPRKEHLLNEIFATVATNLSLVRHDTTGI